MREASSPILPLETLEQVFHPTGLLVGDLALS
jgi:hypothetical protein